MSKVTKLKTPATTRSTDFNGTIQDTALEAALDEVRLDIWEAVALLRITADALDDARCDDPNYPLVLRRASERLDALTGNLEAMPLERRAAEIAQGGAK